MATRRNATRLTRSALLAASDGLSARTTLRSASQSGYALSQSRPLSSASASSALRGSVSSWTLRHQVLGREVTVSASAAVFKLRGHRPFLSRAYSTAASSASQTNPSEYTEMAWEGIVGAVDAARVSKQQVVETEHLMKALLEQKDGLARRTLTKAGLDNSSVLQSVDEFISQQPKVSGDTSGLIMFSNLAVVLDSARKHKKENGR